jgi:hypothetical protein
MQPPWPKKKKMQPWHNGCRRSYIKDLRRLGQQRMMM